MLRSSKDLTGYSLKATDGVIGKVKDLLFDDQKWGIRFLVADTGSWLSSHKVLISPRQLEPPETGFYGKHIPVSLTREKVEKGPLLEDHEPVSRRYEKEFALFHLHSPYWVGGQIWGTSAYPYQEFSPLKEEVDKHMKTVAEIDECHLRSVDEIIDYEILSADNREVGYIGDLILNTKNWRIEYFVVDTRKWLPGRSVIINVDWIDEMDWFVSKVKVNLTKEQIKKSPEYDAKAPVNREYESALYDYYGRPYYW